MPSPLFTGDTVYVLELYRGGEFDCARAFGLLAGAMKEASRLLHDSINQETFVQDAGVDDPDEFLEFLENMNELYEHEDYKSFVECWDEWIAEGGFEGTTPFNFDINERRIE